MCACNSKFQRLRSKDKKIQTNKNNDKLDSSKRSGIKNNLTSEEENTVTGDSIKEEDSIDGDNTDGDSIYEDSINREEDYIEEDKNNIEEVEDNIEDDEGNVEDDEDNIDDEDNVDDEEDSVEEDTVEEDTIEEVKIQLIVQNKNIKIPTAKSLTIRPANYENFVDKISLTVQKILGKKIASKDYIVSYKAINARGPSNEIEDELDFQEFISEYEKVILADKKMAVIIIVKDNIMKKKNLVNKYQEVIFFLLL